MKLLGNVVKQFAEIKRRQNNAAPAPSGEARGIAGAISTQSKLPAEVLRRSAGPVAGGGLISRAIANKRALKRRDV